MLDRIEFLLTEALVALRRNGLMTFAAISTSAVALFLLGGLGYAYYRAGQFASSVSGKFEMGVFMRETLPREDALKAAEQIKAMQGVRAVKLITKEDGWRQQQQELHLSGEGLANPLPDKLDVTLSDVTRADQIAKEIQAMPEVYQPDGIEYSKDAQKLIDQMMKIVRYVGSVLGILLLVTSGILIYNAIRLTVIARRREIRIMQLVGASYFTVRTPFVIEGTIQGAVGGLIAGLLLSAAQSALQSYVQGLTVGVTFPPFPFAAVTGLLIACGASYGFLCSSLAVREPLRQGSGFQR